MDRGHPERRYFVSSAATLNRAYQLVEWQYAARARPEQATSDYQQAREWHGLRSAGRPPRGDIDTPSGYPSGRTRRACRSLAVGQRRPTIGVRRARNAGGGLSAGVGTLAAHTSWPGPVSFITDL